MSFNPKLLGSAVGGAIVVGVSAMAVMESRHQRELITGGHCEKVTEALYTPPPRAHTSCSGEGSSLYCSTWHSQGDPYMRSLWRCSDPSREGRGVEFWRATAEEFGK